VVNRVEGCRQIRLNQGSNFAAIDCRHNVEQRFQDGSLSRVVTQ
jgi:hypothetical protein